MLNPNYSNYSLEELNEVLDSIDSEAYPENYKNLLDEIKLRNKTSNQEVNSKEVEQTDNSNDIAEYWNPEKAKTNQKSVLRLFVSMKIFIVVGALSLPAYFYSYLIDESIYSKLNLIAILVAAVTLICTCRFLFKKNESNIDNNEKDIPNREIKVIFVSVFFSLSSYFISLKSLPVLIHIYILDKNKSFKSVTVAHKAYRYGRKHCKGKVYIKEYENSGLDYICGVLSKDSWDNLEKGDSIKIFGSQSKIGFLVKGAKSQ